MKVVFGGIVLCIIACSSDTSTSYVVEPPITVRIVNAYTSPVDVLVDGNAYLSLPSGLVGSTSTTYGTHTLAFRTNGLTSPAQQFTAAIGSTPTIAAVRASGGSLTSVALDDTNSVVAANATKLRVLHFAANAGTIQVYRTQPDYQTPVSWQFPFTYQSTPNSLSAPFYQSTAGTWEIRVWQTPSDSSGWANAPLKVLVPLKAGEKRTIVILDKAGGGVRAEIL